MLRTISRVTQLATDKPMKTSAPTRASANVRAVVVEAYFSLYSFMPSARPL